MPTILPEFAPRRAAARLRLLSAHSIHARLDEIEQALVESISRLTALSALNLVADDELGVAESLMGGGGGGKAMWYNYSDDDDEDLSPGATG